jgi:hypothetical protein
MADCIKKDEFVKILESIDTAKLIDQTQESSRIDIWQFDSVKIKDVINNGISKFVDIIPSVPIRSKIEGLRKQLPFLGNNKEKASAQVKKFIAEIIDDSDGRTAELSIALSEVMEQVKGDSDKAVKNGFTVQEVSSDTFLPNVPLARVAEIVGRKITYQKGYRFSADGDVNISPSHISNMYYSVGMQFINKLESKGYIDVHENGNTLKDFIDKTSGEKVLKKVDITNKVPSISLNLAMLTKDTSVVERDGAILHFTNRSKSDLTGTDLGSIKGLLNISTLLSVPSNLSVPNRDTFTKEEKARLNENNAYSPDSNMAETLSYVEDNPLQINNTVNSFLTNLNIAVVESLLQT